MSGLVEASYFSEVASDIFFLGRNVYVLRHVA